MRKGKGVREKRKRDSRAHGWWDLTVRETKNRRLKKEGFKKEEGDRVREVIRVGEKDRNDKQRLAVRKVGAQGPRQE